MEILGIGPLELLFFLLIALILFGPDDMVKTGRTIGRFLRRIVLSEEWRTFNAGLRQLRYLPNTLMREAGLEGKEMEDLRKTVKAIEEPLTASKSLVEEAQKQLRALNETAAAAISVDSPPPPAPVPNSAAGYGTWAGQAPKAAPVPPPAPTEAAPETPPATPEEAPPPASTEE